MGIEERKGMPWLDLSESSWMSPLITMVWASFTPTVVFVDLFSVVGAGCVDVPVPTVASSYLCYLRIKREVDEAILVYVRLDLELNTHVAIVERVDRISRGVESRNW